MDVPPERLLDTLLEASADQVAFTDTQGRLLRVSRAFAARLGLADPRDAVGKNAFDLLPRAEAEALLGQPDSGSQPVKEICVGLGGEDRWLAVTAAPLLSEDGKAAGTLTVARDITRWKRTEASLRDAIAVYESLVEPLPINLFRKDREGRFIFANNRLCQTLGLRREELLGKTDDELSPPALAEKYRNDDRRVIETGQTLTEIEEHNPVDGEATFIQTFKAPVRNAAGEVIGTQGFFVDITPLKRTEADLVKKTIALEDVLRALRENQQKLMLSEKMASLGRLTAGIAHEMNSPLAAVRSALLEIEALVEEYRTSVGAPEVEPADHAEIAGEMLKTIRLAASAAERAASFVQGIKSHTRDMAPRQRRSFNAASVVKDTLTLLTHALRKGHCSVSFVPEDKNVLLKGSPGRLVQVVTNLVNNAIDASASKGGGPIEVRLGRAEEAVILKVEDRGSGIAPDVVGKIFDPMFTTKPFGEGTGLGLMIVHDIVVGDFGGTIEVRTEPGLGTTFTVRFPETRDEVSDGA